MNLLTPETCSHLEPGMFVINHAAGGKLDAAVMNLLDPIDQKSFHHWSLKQDQPTKLHYHQFDEYWIWAKGHTMLHIRLPDGRSDRFEIGPGWIVYCVRGIEHGHEPIEDWACFECISVLHDKAQTGHFFRSF